MSADFLVKTNIYQVLIYYAVSIKDLVYKISLLFGGFTPQQLVGAADAPVTHPTKPFRLLGSLESIRNISRLEMKG